jgi:putative PEP-CTERM system histidine kinase
MTAISVILTVGAACCAFAVALAAFRPKPRTLAHLAFAGGMLLVAAETGFNALSMLAILPDEILFWQKLSLTAMAFQPGLWLLFSLSYSRGNHLEFINKWRPTLAAAFVLPLALVLISPLYPVFRAQQPPFSSEYIINLSITGVVLHIILLIASVLILMNLERTFQAAVGTMRWRIKFMMLGLGVLFIFQFYVSSQAVLFSAYGPSIQCVQAGSVILASGLIAVALLRTHAIALDLYPSLSVLHRSLTLVFAGLYLLFVGVFAKIVAHWGGDPAFPVQAFIMLVAVVLCGLLLLSDRFQQHTKRFVSRHFKRSIYDFRQIWRAFTEQTATIMDIPHLCRTTTRIVSETFHALSVTIWIVDWQNQCLVFGASTSLTEAAAQEFHLSPEEITDLLQAASKQSDPIDIAQTNDVRYAVLNKINPDIFGKGGGHLCVALSAGGKLLGIMTVWDRVGGLSCSTEDLDLLKCLGDQIGSNLLNIHLSQGLLQSREMAAFQTMSAFFVHDLKNTAAMLSLMLQNLPLHFEDPEFRADALRAVSRSVHHINDLIERLSLLRNELKIHPVETDLAEVVNAALAGLGDMPGITLVKKLSPTPRIAIDSGQIQSVITNLVLNARDALAQGGEIRVETGRQNGWATVSVSDNGCGMSAEFLHDSLFRPFQTTKKKGIGIGMFHSKMILDAHQGKIDVQSEPGRGTTFKVMLPLHGN